MCINNCSHHNLWRFAPKQNECEWTVHRLRMTQPSFFCCFRGSVKAFVVDCPISIQNEKIGQLAVHVYEVQAIQLDKDRWRA